MKKILLLIALICACSCTCTVEYMSDSEKKQLHRKNTSKNVQEHSEIVDLTFDGETHEYVYFYNIAGSMGSLTHWAGCKYCKQQGYHYNY